MSPKACTIFTLLNCQAGGESQLGDELLERQMQRSQQPSHGHIATDKADDLLNDGYELGVSQSGKVHCKIVLFRISF